MKKIVIVFLLIGSSISIDAATGYSITGSMFLSRLHFKDEAIYQRYQKFFFALGPNAANELFTKNVQPLPFTGDLPLTAGSGFPLTGTLYLRPGNLAFDAAPAASTSYTYGHFSNNSNDFYIGIEGSAGGSLSVGSSAYSAILNVYQARSIQFGTNNTVRYTIDGSGNHTFYGNAVSSTDNIKLLSGSTSAHAAYSLGRNSQEAYWAIASGSDEFQNGSAAGDVVFNSSGKLLFGNTIGGDATMILASGNVGIGITSPSQKLEVSGNIASIYHSATAVGNSFPRIGAINTNATQQDYDLAELYVGAGNSAVLGGLVATYSSGGAYTPGVILRTVTATPLEFWTNNTEAMRIGSNGNIGMGTTTLTEKLSVNGSIRAKKMTITQLDWSDYVFSETYPLPSLSSVEKFISQNKHLPDVPSAKEVNEKGISVGDNQAMLLKKIEEMTLYLIIQQKQIEQQGASLERMAKEIKRMNANNRYK